MRTRREMLLLGAGAAALACGCEPSVAPRGAAHARRRALGVAHAYVRRDRDDVLESRGDLAPDEAIEVASLGKPVFALAVLEEAARGSFDVDAPLPSIAAPPYAHERRDGTDAFADRRVAELTPRLLLSHRGGLPNWSRDAPLAFVDRPGARWRYSGEGYVLLQRALETSRGESLEAFAEESPGASASRSPRPSGSSTGAPIPVFVRCSSARARAAKRSSS